VQCIGERTDYAKNRDKTNDGELISAYACDPHTVEAEFMLSKNRYKTITGREEKSDVIAYQVRQSFKPGEVTPEEANRIGYEFASRFLKGKHAFIVCTHVDKKHIHNHIIWNSTTLDCKRKFRDFLGSGRAVARISDLICTEHRLSVILNPRRGSDSYNQWLDRKNVPKTLIDIEAKLREGKGEGYRRWATVENLKRMAKTKLYMDEHGADYGDICERYSELTETQRILKDKTDKLQKRLSDIGDLKNHIVNYSKTRKAYIGYRKAGYSKKYLAEHEADIIIHKSAKKAFDELGVKKIPTVKQLQCEYEEILREKKEAYTELRRVRDECRVLAVHKSNYEEIRDLAERDRRTENENDRSNRS